MKKTVAVTLCSLALAACASSGQTIQLSPKPGQHRFLVSCPLKEPVEVVSIGENGRDAKSRLKNINKSYPYCSQKYLGYISGTYGKWASLNYEEIEQKREFVRQQEIESREAEEQAKQAEIKRRRLALEQACLNYGFKYNTDQFAHCIKDLTIAVRDAEREERLAMEMRNEVARQGALGRAQDAETAKEARWNAIFQTVVQAGVTTANANRQISNDNLNTNRIIFNQNLNR
jgi:hypothetical protein